MRYERFPEVARGKRINRRTQDRNLVALRRVRIVSDALGAHNAYISEISINGCRLFSKAKLRPGDIVSFSLDDVMMTSTLIIWRDGDCFGCRFNIPIDIGTLRKMAFDIY